MRVILTQDVVKLGAIGEIVTVKNGYARNYLVPRGIAVVANESNQKELDHKRRVLEKKKALQIAEYKKIASQVESTSITIEKQVGEDERIFGTVTTSEIEAALKAEGLDISRRTISLDDDVKKVGVYHATVQFSSEVSAKVKVWVVAQEQ